jgi:hypothetical protein
MAPVSDVIIADVAVREAKGRRVTTIIVIEGRGGDVWPARVTSVPPVVRDELAAWLAAETPVAQEAGGVHVSAGAETTLALDAPGVEARTGFRPT